MCAPAESPQVETTRKSATTDTPLSLITWKPALERLAAAREAHLEQARRMEDTLTAITRAEEQKAELEQDNGSDTRTWRAAFRAGGAMLTDELKSGHIERVARRELAQECDNLTEVLAFERDQLKATCNSTARAFRQAHHAVLSKYAEEELNRALNDTLGPLVRGDGAESRGDGKSAGQHHRPSGVYRAGERGHASGGDLPDQESERLLRHASG